MLSKSLSFDSSSIENLESLLKETTIKENCPSCAGHFNKKQVITTASPFLVVYGDGMSSINAFPRSVKVSTNNKNFDYKLSYIGLKKHMKETTHYSSFQFHIWFHFDPLASKQLTKFMNLPKDTADDI